MTAPRLLLILTENWTMRPPPDVGDLVAFAVEAERAGIDGVMVSEHIVLGPSATALSSTTGLGQGVAGSWFPGRA